MQSTGILGFVEAIDRNQHQLLCVVDAIDCNQWSLLRAVGDFDSSFFCPQNVKASVDCSFLQLFALRIKKKSESRAIPMIKNHLFIVRMSIFLQ